MKTDFGLVQGPFYADENGTLVLRNHKLKLVGLHRVHLWVQGQDENQHRRILHQQDFEFWVDPYAPKLALFLEEEAIVVDASDVGTEPEYLQMRFRDEAQWSHWALVAPLALDGVSVCDLEIQVRDQAGNLSQVASLPCSDVALQVHASVDRERSRLCSSTPVV